MVRSGKNGSLHLKQIAYYKRTGEYHPTTLPSERSGIRRAAKKFDFKEKRLFYIGKDRKQNRLVIVSEEEKRKVLRECHENDTGAHHGISRTLTLVESSYYWTSVTNDVKQWVSACQHCQVSKQPPLLKVEDPWAIVAVDLMGPFLSSSRSQNQYIMMMTDLFTKWVVISPLRDISAPEISKAIANAFFSYGPPQKIVMDQGEEFIYQGSTKNTPYFQMFNRNPHVPETPEVLREVEGVHVCVFAKILDAIKEADRAAETKIPSRQMESGIPDEEPSRSKIAPKRKAKQLNPFHLKVGHEVVRQRKNRWKDGRFHSEWVGPCVIDYVTDGGCAVLRDATGSRLKRPIKMSHLKPYIRTSGDQGSHHLLQGPAAVDHDYIGTSEITVGSRHPGVPPKDTSPRASDDESPTSGEDHELSESKNPDGSPLPEDHRMRPANRTPGKSTFYRLLDASSQVTE
ncbi:gypsy retrotransposon integrase-like protein 1 isoform X2 [Ornithorhynchus anatinus]|uniref:gypsy retrotransposon integrase-like protein 1 isoform X2 n=1 Tax=Ornithorhynchus anatinus TaxID=9258 RepID=UPI0010A8AB68|nr:gypsy retrotransposon integrase-like protein 1 isoform X2 [Ornithorhynchus anatinus]